MNSYRKWCEIQEDKEYWKAQKKKSNKETEEKTTNIKTQNNDY